MANVSDFYGLTAAQLTTLQTNWLACLNAIAVAGQSYSIAGRQFTRANLKEVSEIIGAIGLALARVNGTRTTQTFANFNN